MFRFKRSVKATYNQQGFIYFYSKRFAELTPVEQKMIKTVCHKAGGEHYNAVLEAVTTERSATAVCMRHNLSESTLERAVRRYYALFSEYMG